MFKKIVSLVLVGVTVLSLAACGGGSASGGNNGNGSNETKKGTILTNMNAENYLDFKCEYDSDSYNNQFKNFKITCKSKNSLFKFDNVICNVVIICDDRGYYTSWQASKNPHQMEIDENGNGYIELGDKFWCTWEGKRRFFVRVDSCTGQVFE